MSRDSIYERLNCLILVPRETFDRLSIYHDTLLKWQDKINLISPSTISDAWDRHFIDSIQLAKYLPDNNAVIADIGTGAGFPGMSLAICGYKNIHLIESDTKKIIFLREVARLTNTKVTIHHQRAEEVIIDKCQVILSRACSDLKQLLKLSEKNVSHETISLFHKGKNYSTELEDAKNDFSFNEEIFTSVTDPNGVIIKLSNIHRRRYDRENNSKSTT